ncbi:translocation protein TolB, partial [Candidatus Magnetomorum sp. HK-1]
HRDELNHVLTTTLTDLSEPLNVNFAILYSPQTIATIPSKDSINSDPAPLTDNLIPSPILNTWENDIMDIQHNQPLSQLTIHGGHTPSVLYNSQQIVFMSERSGNEDIWIIDVTDYKESQNTAKPLTRNPAHDRQPSCSPMDDSIAFVSDRDGTYRIYVIKSDGSGLMPLTQEVDPNAHPSWSPDASQLVYIKHNNLYVIQTDGFNETMLTSHGFEKKSHPVWSHDGTRIA